MRGQKHAKFIVGDNVEYFKRGICYPGIIQEDLGILKGTGRRYRITRRDNDNEVINFDFNVAERHLSKEEI